MADFTYSAQAGEPTNESDAKFALRPSPNALTTLTNVAGALVSCALIVGIGVWGYKLLVRDVSGIPVVRAAEGDMRVRPEDPGGQLAQHQGLSVNAVAAEGAAAGPADELRLAPQPVEISEEDAVTTAPTVATAPQEVASDATADIAAPAATDIAAALEAGEVEDLVAQLTAGVTPLSELPAAATEAATEVVAVVTPTAARNVQAAATEAVSAVLDAPGVRQSLRPRKRPAGSAATVVPASLNVEESTPAPATQDVDAASLPAGTRLAQLGAFDSEEVAREQWDQMNIQFGAYLSDKQRIIQRATSGGRVFYRLRAMGFEDIADARRFCSALVAENADCIPVVTR
jgi:hypothetical protein